MGKEIFRLVSSRKERFIWFEGEISRQAAKAFIKRLSQLNNCGTEPIFFYISGPGGSLEPYLDMVVAINNSKSKVFCVSHGWVGSVSFMLTQSVPIGFRLAVIGTKFVFHRAIDCLIEQIKAGTNITQEDYLEDFKTLARLDGLVLAMFFLKCRPDCRGEITELLQAEKIISVNKAIKLGIMDNYFDKQCFLKDRRIVKALLKQRKCS